MKLAERHDGIADMSILAGLHLFRYFDAEEIEAALQDAPGQFRERQARAADRLFRFQNRTRLVKSMESIAQLEQVVGENVGTKIVHHLRDDFGKLEEPLCE